MLVLSIALTACTSGTSRDHAPPPSPTVAASTAAADAPAEVVPGTSIGPLRIGMTRAEVTALGLPTKPTQLREDLFVGPYRVTFADDHVDAVDLPLPAHPAGARVGGAVFDGKAKIEAIAQKLPACGPVVRGDGGDAITCDGGRTFVNASGPLATPTIRVISAARAAGRKAP
ncbi:Hypothetical protein A7982_02175 [Minicystis rosea]|nr:Hypothetical protein A7982_02175 [Minicystis rosea]